MQIKKFQPIDHFVRATVYGGSGVGKTVFGGTAPKAIFASSENGLLSVVSTLGYSPDYVTINSVAELQELYKFLKAGNHEYQTLVIDSMTEINELIKESIEKKIGRPMQIKERGELAKQVKGIIRAMRELPIHVIMICQAKMTTDDDGNVVTVKPMLNGKNADEIAYMMDIVAYMYINNKGERIITTSPNEKLVSKDRTGLLQSDVSLNFNDRVVAMQAMKTGTNEIVQSKQETPVAPIEPTTTREKPIAAADKIIAKSAFSSYSSESNPSTSPDLAFAAFIEREFNGKGIEELTESEGKELIAKVQKVVDEHKAQKESAIQDQEQGQADAEREAQAKEEAQIQKSTVQEVYSDLPF